MKIQSVEYMGLNYVQRAAFWIDGAEYTLGPRETKAFLEKDALPLQQELDYLRHSRKVAKENLDADFEKLTNASTRKEAEVCAEVVKANATYIQDITKYMVGVLGALKVLSDEEDRALKMFAREMEV